MSESAPQTGASAEAIRHHYDIGNEFYSLWLDPTLTYSGAMWQEGDTLTEAQVRKVDYHAREAGAIGAPRVLDVGCGWGGLMRRLVEVHGVGVAVGLTLSDAQALWVAQTAPRGVEVRIEGWEQHSPAEPYDALICVGALEHFARLDMSSCQRIAAYRAFFLRCRDFLRPHQLMSLQSFAYGNRGREQARNTAGTQFLAAGIFPETDPPRLSELADAWETTFEVVRLRNDRRDYSRTCRVWLENLRNQHDAAVALVGPEVVARYVRYLQLSAIGFEAGRLDLYRITLRRSD